MPPRASAPPAARTARDFDRLTPPSSASAMTPRRQTPSTGPGRSAAPRRRETLRRRARRRRPAPPRPDARCRAARSTASAGSAAHFLRVSSPEAPNRMMGCVSPSRVTTMPLAGAAEPSDARVNPPRRSSSSTGSTASIGVPASPRCANDRPPVTSSPPPRSATKSAIIASCAWVKKSPSTLAIASASYAYRVLAARGKSAGQRRGPGGVGLDQKRVAAVRILALPHHRIDLEAGVGRPRAPHERVLEPRRSLDDEQPALSSGRADEHAARVVLGDRLAVAGRDLHGIHRRPLRVGEDGEALLDGRTVRGRRDAAALEQTAVGHQAQFKRRASESAARRRHLQVHRRPIQPLISRRDPEHFAVAQSVGRADADCEHRPAAARVADARAVPGDPVSAPSDTTITPATR